MESFEQTIKKPVVFSGVGLHRGKEVRLSFFPAEEGEGIYFLKEGIKIPALLSSVSSLDRGTNLKLKDQEIMTIEHLLAAVVGIGIDNLEIKIEGVEIPAADGSALPFVKILREVGLQEQQRPRQEITLKKPLLLTVDETTLAVLPSKSFKVTFLMDYSDTAIGVQSAFFDHKRDSFEKEIAPARTFGLLSEVEELQRRGLALGGSLENAVVIGEEGPLNELRFKNELARHKILDILGDFSLLGKRLKAEIIGIKSGHQMNIKMCQMIASLN